VFVFLLSLLVILQQSLSSGYLNSVITTIEKRYEIPSSVSGIIASMYEIGNVFTVIFVSYLGSRRHIPAFIGVGAIVMGLSSILFALPHFLSDSYSASFAFGANITDENICQISGGVATTFFLEKSSVVEPEPELDIKLRI
jgi:organic anion transporter 3A